MKRSNETNEEIVLNIMSFSKHGALAQAFVIDALTKWSAIIAKEDPAKFDSPMMNGNAWVGVAKEISDKLAEKYGANDRS